ncbi:MAG: hypothetical protein ACRD22_06360, partial [Terriglobia bacterium]
TLQLQPQASLRLFGVRWITDQYPELTSQFTTIQSLGGAKYIRGLILDADTQNLQIGVQILGDNQSLLTTITAWLNGHGEQAFAFNPPLLAHALQLAPQGDIRIFGVKWISDDYPELAPIQTSWQDQSGQQFVQGLILSADTQGANVTIQVLTDGDADGPSFVANHSGKTEKPYSFPTPFLAHSLALQPQAPIRIFNLRWITNPAPEPALSWITPPSSLGQSGYAFLRDGWIAYLAPAIIVLQVLRDGIADPSYSLPASPILTKLYLPFLAGKFRTIQFLFISASPFQIMKQDCEVRLRSWGSTSSFQTIHPFGGQNLTDGATI